MSREPIPSPNDPEKYKRRSINPVRQIKPDPPPPPPAARLYHIEGEVMLTRDELERRLEVFRAEMLRERAEDKSRTPANEARVKMEKRPEYGDSMTNEDLEWMFREGVRWYKKRLAGKGGCRQIYADIEEEGTA